MRLAGCAIGYIYSDSAIGAKRRARMGAPIFVLEFQAQPAAGFRAELQPCADRHKGESHPISPATPPDKWVRIRRFEELRSTERGDSQLMLYGPVFSALSAISTGIPSITG
jgi:hypothetical protein